MGAANCIETDEEEIQRLVTQYEWNKKNLKNRKPNVSYSSNAKIVYLKSYLPIPPPQPNKNIKVKG